MTLPQKIDAYLKKGNTQVTADKMLGAFYNFSAMLSYNDFKGIAEKLGYCLPSSLQILRRIARRGGNGESILAAAEKYASQNCNFTCSELRHHLRFNNGIKSPSSHDRALKLLIENGKIERVKLGVYRSLI